MIRTIFSFIGALIGYIWSFISGPVTRIVVPIMLGLFFLFCLIFGISFVVIYKEIFLVLIALISLGIWIPVIRPVRNFLLVIWAIWFVIEVVAIGIVWPAIDNLLKNSNPAYAEMKHTVTDMFENRTEESIVSMKKEMMNSESVMGTFGEMKEDSPVYDESGTIIPDIILKKGQKVMSLGTESKKQADGSEGMAYVSIPNEHGHFVKGVKALVPIRMIEWDSNQGKTSPTVKTGWVEIENRIVDFSQIRMATLGQNQCMAEIPLPIKISESGNYRMKFSGNWEFLMSNGRWSVFPWNGNNALAGRPEFRPEKGLNFGSVILINNGANITPVNDEGFITTLGENSVLLVRINVLLRPDEYMKASGIALRNSMAMPLTITIEKETAK